MNVKILTLVIVLLVSLLCSASAGPIMTSTEHGTALEEAGGVRRVAQQNPGRGGAHAILEHGTTWSAHPQVLISMLFLCLGGHFATEGPCLPCLKSDVS
ncbi:hypothetical protein DPEC_G00022960 [Dallia pectoralis]|uniref:Uncharacterized protein n=1 Tax=Dallia pectoralis TaxID=75939 RepID=A0ACC2HHM0_DALPE|nr:hypothetical protein DPEC_G00022960 [Dallia pectoralis]